MTGRKPEDQQQRRRSRDRFHDLMRHRVRHILLVSSLYDSFTLAEDGQLNQALLRQSLQLNMSHHPDVVRVSTGDEALRLCQERTGMDLIVTSLQVGDMDACEFARRLRDVGVRAPVILLAYNNRALIEFGSHNDLTIFDHVFLWRGDVGILLAMVQQVEDLQNVSHDVGQAGVPAIIVVEDNVRFYSSFLPAIYSEITEHTQRLLAEGLNLSEKMLRMRARPKVLLATDYEQAWSFFEKYESRIMGIISDVEFPRGGVSRRDAGLRLIEAAREKRPDLTVILQSSIPENEALANAQSAAFLLKGSPTLLTQLRRLLKSEFGFGDFVFQTRSGEVVDRACDMKSLLAKLRTVPAESLAFHAERNHFSMWLKARTEFDLADKLKARSISDFRDLEHMREELIQSVRDHRTEKRRSVVADFNRDDYDGLSSLVRIGGGSLGGKARGLALVNRVLNEYRVQRDFPDIPIEVPVAAVLGTDVFDEFLTGNCLDDFALGCTSDTELEQRFMFAPFLDSCAADLERFLQFSDYPLAVRSSGLLEDSQSQAFAGVYQTYMLPNNDPDPAARLRQLIAAIKRVYASTFSNRAKGFLDITPYRLEEEKMAVLIQRVVGRRHGSRFYPDFSGVARSHNFYPIAPATSSDGVVAVALGLGMAVVDGGNALRFCPRYPLQLPGFSSVDDLLRNSQREFYALELEPEKRAGGVSELEIARFGLDIAEQDGTLAPIGSTYSPDNETITDGTSRPGVRLVSFASVLKHDLFPLAEILSELLEVGRDCMAGPVEIEFAVNLRSADRAAEFGFLQMRPLPISGHGGTVEIGDELSSRILCRSESILGHGVVDDLHDILVVDYHRFDRMKSRDAAAEVAKFNAQLQQSGTPYLLIGVGRWGSTDPFLGIPVTWNQIAGARVIVEAGFKDFRVTPSQGTHFFQNLTSCDVGYFTVNPEVGEGSVDWDWLTARSAVAEGMFVRHLHFERPLTVKMDGKGMQGVILKPGAA